MKQVYFSTKIESVATVVTHDIKSLERVERNCFQFVNKFKSNLYKNDFRNNNYGSHLVNKSNKVWRI